VTEIKASPLFDFATKHQRPILEVPLDVGGRFSVLTAVGMLPAAFMGLNTEEFRAGAESALAMKERVISVSAHALQSFEREEWITLFWHYSSLTRYFGGWIQQLWAESLAKETDRKQNPAKRASTPMSAIGACDQHSILQQVMAGAKDKFVLFVRVGSAESSTETLQETVFPQHKYLLGKGLGQILAAEAEATSLALTQSQVSNMVLHIPDLSPRTVGFLFMFWELVVGLIGEAMNINAFDQPGVELGKRLAKQILDPTKLS
jgi:glucose-6-phosphate isomerase